MLRFALCGLSCIADPRFKGMFDLLQEAFTSIAGERHGKANTNAS